MIPMDIYAVYKGLWSFSGKGTLGIHIFNLPIEEYLFAIIVPYFMLMVYKAIHKKFK
jgi:lycopene cyclase domain-containing protein